MCHIIKVCCEEIRTTSVKSLCRRYYCPCLTHFFRMFPFYALKNIFCLPCVALVYQIIGKSDERNLKNFGKLINRMGFWQDEFLIFSIFCFVTNGKIHRQKDFLSNIIERNRNKVLICFVSI